MSSSTAWIIVAILIATLLALVYLGPFKASPTTASAPPAPLQASVQMQQPIKSAMSSGPSNVVELQSADDGDKFLSQGPGILMVYAPWCGHCKFMMPAFDEASTKTTVKFARLEGSRAGAFMQKHQIRGFPTIITVDANNIVGRHNGGRGVQDLLSSASQLASAVPAQPAPVAVTSPQVEASTNDSSSSSSPPAGGN